MTSAGTLKTWFCATRRAYVALGLIVAVFLGSACCAAEVVETLPSGIKVTADYRPAPPGAPAVLILHGFMVTSGFPIVQALVEDLSAKGYAVLAPTLSLGVSGRRAGLACEAIHAHTRAGDVAEVAFWVDWLVKKGAGTVVLVGHSFGSTQLLDYLAHAPGGQVVGLVGMSLSHADAPGEPVDGAELARARDLLARGDTSLGRYHLIYCHGNYTATAGSFVSYAELKRGVVIDWVGRTKRPIIAIMGGGDQRFGADWVKDMQQAGVRVKVIPGASHFFDGTFEFDLLDAVARSLQELNVRP